MSQQTTEHLSTPRHVDVIIVGAGLSGVAAGYYLQAKCPGKSYMILEGREALGGTWDLFRYPGIRSDSDMYTLGYSFRPWLDAKAIADGASILEYVRATAQEFGIDRKIQFQHRVLAAAWSSVDSTWTLDVEQGAQREPMRFTCNFLFTCSGYYDYAGGYKPDFPSIEKFAGQVIHPQKWPADFDCTGKRVVVIGSGATAVTLVPALAARASHVTMLQRSPSYIVSLPSKDAFADRVRASLPPKLAHGLVRWRNVLLGLFFYTQMRRRPVQAKARIIGMIRKQLGPDYDVATHFTPNYNPWDQRLCLVPDADLFRALRAGNAEVVTDLIECFTETGIRLRSGREIDADIVVTATGLQLQLLGGMQISVDGKPVDFGKTTAYRGLMYSDVPNLATAFGYTNASWTLKCELSCAYVCRLLNYMDNRGYAACTPRKQGALGEHPLLDFNSGYVQRSISLFPRQGNKRPWRVYQNYVVDRMNFQMSRINDGSMEFTKREGLRKRG